MQTHSTRLHGEFALIQLQHVIIEGTLQGVAIVEVRTFTDALFAAAMSAVIDFGKF